MTKRQLIDEIVVLNRTAQPSFLAKFGDGDLRAYLEHLRLARTPRLTGRPGRYDRYFTTAQMPKPRPDNAFDDSAAATAVLERPEAPLPSGAYEPMVFADDDWDDPQDELFMDDSEPRDGESDPVNALPPDTLPFMLDEPLEAVESDQDVDEQQEAGQTVEIASDDNESAQPELAQPTPAQPKLAHPAVARTEPPRPAFRSDAVAEPSFSTLRDVTDDTEAESWLY